MFCWSVLNLKFKTDLNRIPCWRDAPLAHWEQELRGQRLVNCRTLPRAHLPARFSFYPRRALAPYKNERSACLTSQLGPAPKKGPHKCRRHLCGPISGVQHCLGALPWRARGKRRKASRCCLAKAAGVVRLSLPNPGV